MIKIKPKNIRNKQYEDIYIGVRPPIAYKVSPNGMFKICNGYVLAERDNKMYIWGCYIDELHIVNNMNKYISNQISDFNKTEHKRNKKTFNNIRNNYNSMVSHYTYMYAGKEYNVSYNKIDEPPRVTDIDSTYSDTQVAKFRVPLDNWINPDINLEDLIGGTLKIWLNPKSNISNIHLDIK